MPLKMGCIMAEARCSVTPGFSLPSRVSQLDPTSSVRCQEGASIFVMESGAKQSGVWPALRLRKPRGATPTISTGWAFSRMRVLSTAGSAPRWLVQ